MAGHARHGHRERAVFALTHPGMAWRWLLRKDLAGITPAEIAPWLPPDPVILEAGACDGTDTARMAAQWPGAVIHAFEPVPELHAETAGRTAGLPGVRLHQLALSGDPGPVTMHVLDLPGVSRGASSLLTRPPGLPAPTRDIEVSAVTIAGWAEAEGVQRIDLMWLDMEGMELAALKAAGPVLGTVRAVCMEVSREQSRPGAPCYPEVVSWMRAQGFLPVIDRVSLWFGNILFARPGARTRLRRGQEW